MPAEYTACVESYTKKGVSLKTAKGRCAAMYYKRHGKTVNEAAKESGEATISEEDSLYQTIVNIDGYWKKATATCGCSATMPTTITATMSIIAINTDLIEEGLVEIVATRIGAKAYTSDGVCLTWPETTLRAMSASWTGGTVSINHKLQHLHGTILASWFEEPDNTRMLLHVDEHLSKWVPHAELGIGVSIEASDITYDEKDFTIQTAKGTGVTFVFPPEAPACTQEEGCGIIATEVAEKDLTNSINTVSATEDVAQSEKDSASQGEEMTDVTANEKALADKLAASELELAELRAFKEAKVAEERADVLKVIATFVDATPYKDEHLCSLKAVASALIAYQKKTAEEPIVGSGVTAQATEPAAPVIEDSPELKEAKEAASKYEARYGKKLVI